MATILCIETATSICSVALSRNSKVVTHREISGGYAHAEKLVQFISELIAEAGIANKDLEAISVSSGPGSYTGLRIGISTAKGLCYALDIPLISISTLQSLAWKLKEDFGKQNTAEQMPVLFCPMIDARRMEVYTALYDENLKEVIPVSPLVIDESSFSTYLEKHRILFTGDGAEKCREVLEVHPNADFSLAGLSSAVSQCALANDSFANNRFENLALFEPFYLKEYKAGKSSILR